MGEIRRFFWALVLLALAVAAIGCGSDSSDGTGAEEATGAQKEVLFPRVKGPGREFLIRGGDNQVQFFGEETTPREREKASKVIHAWMKARVAEDWALDCKYLSREYIPVLLETADSVSGKKAKSCPQALEYLGDLASGTSGNTLTGPIDSLRVRETQEGGDSELEAFAQWHGPEKDWTLPLKREDGIWRVDMATPLAREA
jgi:hypothetical protein